MKRKRHTPEQIIRKLRDADRMLSEGKDIALVCQSLEVSEATLRRRRRAVKPGTTQIGQFLNQAVVRTMARQWKPEKV